MNTTPPRLLTASSLARRLRVPVRWLKSEATAGRLPHVKAERTYLFDAEVVEKILLERASKTEGLS